MLKNLCLLLGIFFFLSLYSFQSEGQPSSEAKTENKIDIKSTVFEEGGMIPRQYTCDGKNVSPPLKWSFVPEGTKSLALIVDDPDAPVGVWVHWVLFDLPPDTKELNENIPAQETLTDGAKQGKNDFGKIGYGGPCPPDDTHRYFFNLYALDVEINLQPGITKGELLKAMEGHILAQGELMGRYKR
ncbi:MAG: YbhB/YbcL family Raf kinase inhibitor-like protein [Deltaproteobacteria bacterium]|nr:YbhB/YbcL family Raf kinase inhibitor-like protein [Deltaproteobacteria bacterium]